jgi:L-aminopeptidase/D-esterase-like protein
VPAELTGKERYEVLETADKVFSSIKCNDFGRVDIRLSEDGTPYFIELNPLASLHPKASLMQASASRGLAFRDVIELIIRSASRRQNLDLGPTIKTISGNGKQTEMRPTAREKGITIGRFETGLHNAITDIEGVKVGHVTHIEDNVQVPGVPEPTRIRTGVTAILPSGGDEYEKLTVAGGFVLNGIGEMAGLIQVLEWNWIETPIMLTNTMAVGQVHWGVISYLQEHYSRREVNPTAIIPVVGEANDAFLNDVRVGRISVNDVKRAITTASSGSIQQGSVGAGTGMISFDFAGGIGTSSRVLPEEDGGYTVGVLVLSNFGKMRNLTIDGAGVVGRELDKIFPQEGRRKREEGSVIVVVGTDAPLLSSQLNRLSRRAAIGLGRTGSHASSTSGEIIVAFSTGNRMPRTELGKSKKLSMNFVADTYINPIYEAVVEATEEAVLNAIFCSNGMDGRANRSAPALPHDEVLKLTCRIPVAQV